MLVQESHDATTASFKSLPPVSTNFLDQSDQKELNLQTCLRDAVGLLHEFLDNSKRIAACNTYLESIIHNYQSSEPTVDEKIYYNKLKIVDDIAPVIKEAKFSCSLGGNRLCVVNSENKHIQFDPRKISQLSYDDIVQIILHETHHVIHRLYPDGQVILYNHFSRGTKFSLEEQHRMKKASELAADALSSFIKPKPGFSSVIPKLLRCSIDASGVDEKRLADLTGFTSEKITDIYFSEDKPQIEAILNWETICKKNGGYPGVKHWPEGLSPDELAEKRIEYGLITSEDWARYDAIQDPYYRDQRCISSFKEALRENDTYPSARMRFDNARNAEQISLGNGALTVYPTRSSKHPSP